MYTNEDYADDVEAEDDAEVAEPEGEVNGDADEEAAEQLDDVEEMDGSADAEKGVSSLVRPPTPSLISLTRRLEISLDSTRLSPSS